MATFNILQIWPTHPDTGELSKRHHGLNGYAEVIQTVVWGLQKLGHTVFVTKNTYLLDARNIIFGHQLAHEEYISIYPNNSIVYNLEQLYGFFEGKRDFRKTSHKYTAKNFEIWDYSHDNIEYWQSLGCEKGIKYVPISYAPIWAPPKTPG